MIEGVKGVEGRKEKKFFPPQLGGLEKMDCCIGKGYSSALVRSKASAICVENGFELTRRGGPCNQERPKGPGDICHRHILSKYQFAERVREFPAVAWRDEQEKRFSGRNDGHHGLDLPFSAQQERWRPRPFL